MIEAVRSATYPPEQRLVEITPVQVRSGDNGHVRLDIDIRNLRPHDLKGSFVVESSSEGAPFPATQTEELELKPGQVLPIEVALPTSATGRWPLKFRFDSGGQSDEWQEVVQDTRVRYASPKSRKDWEQLPAVVALRGKDEALVNEMESVWLPFVERPDDTSRAKMGELRLAYDDKALHIFASVDCDHTPVPKPRFSEWTGEENFYSKADDEYLKQFEPFADVLGFSGKEADLKENPRWKEWEDFAAANPEIPAWNSQPMRWIRAFFMARNSRLDVTLQDASYAYKHGMDFIQDLPFSGDVLQIAFDWDRREDRASATHDLVYPSDKLPVGYHVLPDTDYEFSAYLCEDGKPELWCLLAPGIPRSHYFPRAPKGEKAQHAVEGVGIAVEHQNQKLEYTLSIPWQKLGQDGPPTPGSDFGFTFAFGASKGGAV